MLRSECEEHDVAFSIAGFRKGDLTGDLVCAEHPAGHQCVFRRIPSDGFYVSSPAFTSIQNSKAALVVK